MTKLVLLNGPKECGKSELVKALKALTNNTVDRRTKDKLFELTIAFFCLTEEQFWTIYNNRVMKETPHQLFTVTRNAYDFVRTHLELPLVQDTDMCQLSCREALIYVSEVITKPTFGQDYLGVARAKSIQPGEFAIDDSAGFDDELPPSIEKLGQDNVLLIRIYGRGSFEGDSRKYISNGVVRNTVDLYNTGSEEDFQREALRHIQKFYRGY